MTSPTCDVVVAGYLGVDIAPGFAGQEAVPFAELFRPGKLIETHGLHFSLGGVVANTGLALKRFGCRTAFMGCVGNDALGDLALAQLKKVGVSEGIQRTDRAGTAYGIVLAPPGSDRLFLEDPGCNRSFSSDDIDFDIVRQSRLFHFGYPPLMDALWREDGAALKALLKRVRACGATVSLDMTLPDPNAPAGKADWSALLGNVLPVVDIFVPSIEELVFMLEPELYADVAEQSDGDDLIDAIPVEAYNRIAEKALAMGVKVLLVKAGHKGAYLRTGNLAGFDSSIWPQFDRNGCPDGVWLEPFLEDPARVCNASGAGDCAIAGFLAALLKGEDVTTAGKYGMMAGRDNLYGVDAISGLADWDIMSKSMQLM